MRRSCLAVAWVAILPVADAGTILSNAVWHLPPPSWVGPAEVASIAALVAAAFGIAHLRPLRGYALALLAITAGSYGVERIEQSAAWMHAFAHGKSYVAALARAGAQVLPCGLLALTLIGSGLARRDVFVTTGDMSAPSPLTIGGRAVRWTWLGPLIALVLAAGLVIQLTLTLGVGVAILSRALGALPLAMVFAAVNAAQEEFQFRAVLLARLRPVVGATQALLITSALFGLAHWFGHPSGPSGVLMAAFAGYVWGRSMIDTGGAVWAWLIHAVQDIVIFTFFVAAA